MKKIICFIISLAIMLLSFSYVYAADTNPIRVGIIFPDKSVSEYWKENGDVFLHTFSEENGYNPVIIEASTSAEQVKAAESLVAEKVSYLLICAVDSSGWKSVLQKANKAKIKVILIGKMVDCDAKLYTAAVMSDHYAEGEAAAHWLEALKLKKYKVLVLSGPADNEVLTEHIAALKTRKFKITYKETENGSFQEACDVVIANCQNSDRFNVIIAANDEMAMGVTEGLNAWGIAYGYSGERKVGEDIILISFSSHKWAVKQLKPDLNKEWGLFNYVGLCGYHEIGHADVVYNMIRTLESGNKIEGLNKKKQYFSEGKGFDAQTITADDISKYGDDESPSPELAGLFWNP